MESLDGLARIEVEARETGSWPRSSIFATLEEASEFFRAGSVGYAATEDPRELDATELETFLWQVSPLAVERARASFFEDPAVFPAGSVALDGALLMRGLPHAWHARGTFRTDEPCRC